MYLMEGRKLLDAQVFNGRQKLLKLSLETFLSVDFREFSSFSHFYIYLELKIICSFFRKNDSQYARKKELKAMRGEREFFVWCM